MKHHSRTLSRLSALKIQNCNMGFKARVNKALAEAKELNKEKLEKFISELPTTVEEVNTLKTVRGADIIAECLAKGDTAQAAQHDSEKTYQRLYTQLRPMDHRANAMSAYRKKGVAGLRDYKAKVLKQAYYIKGKYPQFFAEEATKETLWEKIKKHIPFLKASVLVAILTQCTPVSGENQTQKIYDEYREGFRIGRLTTYGRLESNEIKAVMRKDSIRIYQTYQQ